MRTVSSLAFASHVNTSSIEQCCNKCMSSKYRHSGVRPYPSLAWKVLIGVALITGFVLNPASGNFVQIQLSLNKTCENWAQILVKLPDPLLGDGMLCHASYTLVAPIKLMTVEIHPTSHEWMLTLGSLQEKTAYTIQMSCGETLQSNNLTFTTGSRCMVAVSEDPEVKTVLAPIEENEIIHSSIRDAILGVFIALVGITIAIVVLYYLYKNHRRRQRILRIFRHSQSDPFETLQDHMEEASSSSL